MQTQTYPQGKQYLIRVRKQYADVRTDENTYARRIFRHLQPPVAEATTLTLINTRRHFYFLTSPISRDDAYRIFSGWGSLPNVEVYPILRDTEYGYPYRRIMCVRTFLNRKSDRLPKVVRHISNYRWVAYEKAGAVEGLLISEEPPVVPYPCELSTEANIITCFSEEGLIRYTNLVGYYPEFTLPLR
jgi:hypothetical protein